MLGLTTLGVIHTAISLVAVAAGIVALMRDKAITGKNSLGNVYVIATALTCLTGFGIYQHGGFGKPHVLGILTLLALGVAALAERSAAFSAKWPSVATVTYSLTLFFHAVPAITETTTRFPLGAPFIADREGPELKMAAGVCFVIFVIGAVLQVRRRRREGGSLGSAGL